MKKLLNKIEDIARELRSMRDDLTQQMRQMELSYQEYQIKCNYLSHLMNHSVQLSTRLRASSCAYRSSHQKDALLLLLDGAKIPAGELATTHLARMTCAQRFFDVLRELSELATALTQPARIPLLTKFFIKKRSLRLSRKINGAYQQNKRHVTALNLKISEIAKQTDTPINTKADLERLTTILAEVDLKPAATVATNMSKYG